MKTLREKLKEIRNEETSTSFIEKIKKLGVHTGSSAWGVNNDNSDIDFIFSPKCGLNFEDVIQLENGIYLHEDLDNDIPHYFQDNFRSCYVICDDKIYNLLFFFNEQEYFKWEYATQEMNERIKDADFKEKIKDKCFRVDYFEDIKRDYYDI